jgi:hypothetical protein
VRRRSSNAVGLQPVVFRNAAHAESSFPSAAHSNLPCSSTCRKKSPLLPRGGEFRIRRFVTLRMLHARRRWVIPRHLSGQVVILIAQRPGGPSHVLVVGHRRPTIEDRSTARLFQADDVTTAPVQPRLRRALVLRQRRGLDRFRAGLITRGLCCCRVGTMMRDSRFAGPRRSGQRMISQCFVVHG